MRETNWAPEPKVRSAKSFISLRTALWIGYRGRARQAESLQRCGAHRFADALHSETKVLFTSAYTENAIVHQGALNPDVAHLQKPFTPSALAGMQNTSGFDKKDTAPVGMPI